MNSNQNCNIQPCVSQELERFSEPNVTKTICIISYELLGYAMLDVTLDQKPKYSCATLEHV